MGWADDSWKDSYDAWKLASPDDEYDGPECDHDDYDIDVLDGRARCICGHSWNVTNEEIEREIERQAAYDEYLERENRRQWWRDLFSPVLYPLSVIHWHLHKLKIRWRKAPVIDDDIPF